MNLIRIDAKIRCTPEVAKELVGVFDHVEYQEGIVSLHKTATSEDNLIADAQSAMDDLAQRLLAVGYDQKDGLEFGISTEALIEDGGVWRRRGEIIHDRLIQRREEIASAADAHLGGGAGDLLR